MTNAEAYLRFRVNYDAIASLQAPQLGFEEINSLMNQTYMNLITALNKSKMYDDLCEITVVEKLNLMDCAIEQLGDYAFQADMTNLTYSFLYHVNSHVLVTNRNAVINVANQWMSCVEINRKDADYYIQQPGNYQVILYPKVFFHFNSTLTVPIVMTDKQTTITKTAGYQIAYIKTPVAIDLTPDNAVSMCELGPDWHEVIVDGAVNLATKATDEDRIKMSLENAQRQKQQKQQGTR